ncbi:MAG: hypothetical protein ABIK28_02560 [Planctomycetota bacterium]
MIFEPLTFIEKLCALVPPPRQHLVTYHCVLAPNAWFRGQVIPQSKVGSFYPRKRKNPIPLEEANEGERRKLYTFADLLEAIKTKDRYLEKRWL